MNYDEYIVRVKELKDKLQEVTNEYIESNKKYNIGDYLRVKFKANDKIIQKVCQIMNIYLEPHNNEKIMYLARYVWKNESGNIIIGDVCRLGELSDSRTICGYIGVDWNTIQIDVIDESDL